MTLNIFKLIKKVKNANEVVTNLNTIDLSASVN